MLQKNNEFEKEILNLQKTVNEDETSYIETYGS